MSKKNNISRKNSKTSKNDAKKATRSRISSKKNFKIENLEPRLMMDASAGFDVEKIEEYESRFDVIADAVAENVVSSIGSFTEFDVSKLGIYDKIDSPIALFSDLEESFKSDISDKIAGVLKDAVNDAADADESVTLSQFVGTYIDGVLKGPNKDLYKDFSFEAVDNKIVVTINVSNQKTINDINFDIEKSGKITTNEATSLSSSAQIQVSVDLDKNGDGIYLNEDSDFSVESPVVKKIESVIKNLGLKAKFKNLSFAEQNLDDSPDMRLSYAGPGSDVSTEVDLEFKLENSEGMPFTVGDSDFLKITKSGETIDVKVPEFQIKENFLMDSVLKGLSSVDLSIFDYLKIPVGSNEFTVSEVASQMNVLWNYVLGAILNNLEEMKLDVAGFNSSMTSSKDECAELKDVFDGISVVNKSSDLTLVEGNNTIALQIDLKSGCLNKLDLGFFDLENVDMNSSFGIDIVLNVKDGKFSFTRASLQSFNLIVPTKNVASVKFNGFDVTLDGGKFDLGVSIVNSNGRLKVQTCSGVLAYSGIVIKSVDSSVLLNEKSGNFTYSYSGNSWVLPNSVSNLIALYGNDSFSINSIVNNAGPVPFLQNANLPIEGTSLSVQQLVSKVDSIRNDLSRTIAKCLSDVKGEAGAMYSIDAKSLQSEFMTLANSKLTDSSKKNLFSTINLELGSQSINLLETPVEGSVFNLSNGQNVFKITFKPKQSTLSNFDVYGSTLSSATVDTEIGVNFAVQATNKGVSLGGVSLDCFKFTVKPVGNVAGLPYAIDSNGIVISFDSGKWNESGVDFSELPKISFKKFEDSLTNSTTLKNGLFQIGGASIGASSLVKKIDGVWTEVSKAFTSALNTDSLGINADAMKNTLDALLADKKNEVIAWLSDVNVVEKNVNGGVGKVYSVIFALQTAYMDKLDVHSQSLKNLGVKTSIKVDVGVSKKQVEGSPEQIVYDNINLASVLFDVDLKNAMSDELPYSISSDHMEVSWNGTVWNENIPEITLKDDLSLKNSLAVLENTDIPKIGKLSSLSNASSKAETYWNCLTEALHSVFAGNVANRAQLKVSDLKTAFKSVLTTNKISAGNSAVQLIELKNVGGQDTEVSHDLLGTAADDTIITLNQADNVLNFVIGTNDFTLGKLSLDGIDFDGVVANGVFYLNVDAFVDGKNVSLKKAAFDSFELNVAHDLGTDKTVKLNVDKLQAELKNAKLSLKVSINSDEGKIETGSLEYDSLDVKCGNTSLITDAQKDSLNFTDGAWKYSHDLAELVSIVNADSFSLQNAVKIASDFKFPYEIGEKLKIGQGSYSAEDILKIVDEIRTNVMLALSSNITDASGSCQLNLPSVKAVVDALNASVVSLNSVGVKDFFTAIKIKYVDSADGDMIVDILNDDESSLKAATITGNSLTIEFCSHVDKQKVKLTSEGTQQETDVDLSIVVAVEIGKTGNQIGLTSKFNSFKLEMPQITSAGSAFDLENGQLEVSITETGAQSNVKLNDLIEQTLFPMDKYFGEIDKVEIPFLEQYGFSLGGNESYSITNILENLDSYSKYAQYGIVMASIQDFKLNFGTLHSILSSYIDKKIPLGSIAVLDYSLDDEKDDDYSKGSFVELLDNSNLTGSEYVDFHEGRNAIVFKVSPKTLKYAKNIDLKLLNLGNFEVEFDVYLKFVIDVYKNDHEMVLKSLYFDKVGVSLSVDVSELNLGLFKAKFEGGKLRFDVTIDPHHNDISDFISSKKIELKYKELTLVTGGMPIASLSGAGNDCFSYNIDTEEWTLPDTIRQFASFSGDNLITQVHTVLNTTQTALRSLVERKTKLDFLDGSIERVVDIVEKVERVAYGDKDNQYGLFKKDKENNSYQPRFNDVESFATEFNNAWYKFVCGVDPLTILDADAKIKYCKTSYKYEKNDDYVKYDKNRVLADDDKLQKIKLEFTLGFNYDEQWGLDFAKALGNQLANISTCGNIHVTADANIGFNMIIDFESQSSIDETSKLDDIGLFDHVLNAGDKNKIDVSQDEHYTEFAFNTKKFDEKLYVKLNKNDKTELTTIEIYAKKELSQNNTDWYKSIDASKKVDINYTVDKCIYITAEEKFDIENGAPVRNTQDSEELASGGDAFAELKLTGSNLQTKYTAVFSDEKWSINFIDEKSKYLNENGSIKTDTKIKEDASIEIEFGEIEKLVEKGIILEKFDKKRQINEYLCLLKDSENDFVKLPTELYEGRSIMNTYGLYVVDIIKKSGDLFGVVFGCDSRLIQSDDRKDRKRYLLCEKNNGFVNKITYMRISTEIMPSMNTPNLKGAFVYNIDDDKKLNDESAIKNIIFVEFDSYIQDRLKEYECEKFDESKIQTIVDELNAKRGTSLEDIIEFRYDVIEKNSTKYWVISLVSKKEDYRVKLSDSVLKIDVGSNSIFVNVDNCLTVSNLAKSVENAIKIHVAKNSGSDFAKVSSVRVVDGKIVFVATSGVEIKVSDESVESDNSDFKIGKCKVDFQECLTDAWEKFEEKLKADGKNSDGMSIKNDLTVQYLLDEINRKLLSEKIKIQTVKDGDHFEIVRTDELKDPFTLTSVGASNVLEWLGFVSGQEAKLVGGEMKIVGTSVINFDWAKAIDLESIVLKADVSFDVGKNSIGVIGKPKLETDRVTLEISDSDDNAYKVDGFLKLNNNGSAKYCRILKVNVDKKNKVQSIVVSIQPLNDEKILSNASDLSTWKDALYVASASASVSFLGVDVIAEGHTSLSASFTLTPIEENSNSSSNNLSNSEVPASSGESSGTSVTSESQNDGSFEFLGFNVKSDLDFGKKKNGEPDENSIKLTAYADVFGKGVYLASGSVEAVKPNELSEREKNENPDQKLVDYYRLDANFGVNENALDKILGQFKDFSIEKLFAILETLIERVDQITKNSDVKIPVINKSVRDLVNVANDLRDIIARLRAERVTTIQKFGDLLNTYLEEFGLESHGGYGKLFELKPVSGTDGKFKSLELCFNIQKNFETRHRFSFGGETSGVNGNIDLDVTGGFWFSVSARLCRDSEKNEFYLALVDCSEKKDSDEIAIKFGADIGIAGDKMRFDLGINAGNGQENLLSNLISVGSDKNEAFIYGKVCFNGSFGSKKANVDGDQLKLSALSSDSSLSYSLPVAIFGKLPVYACNMSLGDVLIGKCMNGDVMFKSSAKFADAKNAVEMAMDAYLDPNNTSQNKADSLFVVKKDAKGTFDFELRTDKNTNTDNKFVVDFSDAYEKISDLASFENMDWFSKIKLAVAGLNNLFEMLESGMNSGMGSKLKSVPVLGTALSSGVDFLSVLRDKILDPFSKYVYESTGLTAEMVAKKMNSLLDGYLLNVNYDPNDNYYFSWDDQNENKWTQSGNDGKGTWYRNNGESAEWFFNLGGTYEYGKSIEFDLGFPGLGLSSNAGLDLSLAWALEFGFGISQTKGFYFIFGNGDEISVTASATLDGKIIGSLAGLGLALDVNRDNTYVTLDFGVDLNKPGDTLYNAKSGLSSSLKADEGKTQKTLTDAQIQDFNKPFAEEIVSSRGFGIVELSAAFAKPTFDYSASVNIDAIMTVGVTKDLDRNTPKFPNISGNFKFEWSYMDIEGVKESRIGNLGFYNLNLDMGSFISGVLGPIISKIQKVIEPLEPLIDFLTTPFPVLKDLGIKMTPLDLAKKYSKGEFDDSMVYAIKDLIAVSKTISAIKGKGLSIKLGDFVLVEKKNVDPNLTEEEKQKENEKQQNNSSAEEFLKGKSSTDSVDVGKYSDKLKNNSDIGGEADKELKNQGLHMDGSGKWEFIWNNPSKIFKLLLGEDVDLVKYTMPKLCFEFDWSQFIRIWGPLGARIGVTFSASIQLGFGYDTLGIRQWVKSDYKDYGRLLNGFYVADKDETGYDVNELSFYGGLTASAEVNVGVSAGVGGGVGINVGFNLYDPNNDGKVRLSEMGQIIKEDGLFGLFDVNGKITAKLYAYVDLLFYTKKWNITKEITLFEFDYKHSAIPVMASSNENGDVVGHVGPNAGDRISTDKVNPTLNDGDETIALELSENTVYWADRKKSETVAGGKKLIIDGGVGIDTITLKGKANFDIEIMGGDGDDVIDLSELTMLDDHAVVIWGGSGNDTIYGAKGLNIIFGDTGVARIDEEKKKVGTDDEYVSTRKFVVDANVVADGAGDDTIVGNNDASTTRNIIVGGAGKDKIYGGAGNDIIFGDGGKVEFKVFEFNPNEEGQKKYNVKETEPIQQSEWNVVAHSNVKENVKENIKVSITRTDISLDGGDDVILGGAGDDYIYGGAGNDRIDGGKDSDTVYGERGHDVILGGSGVDEIHGGSGHDIIFGDSLQSGLILTSLFDKEFFSDEFRDVHFNNKELFENPEEPQISRDNFFKVGNYSGGDDLVAAGIDYIYGDEGDDLIFGDSGTNDGADDHIEGGIGNDVIDGNGGNDTISGGIDNDIIYGGLGNDIIDGGAGNDSLYGDNGVHQYKGDLASFEKDQITFGENLGLSKEIYKNVVSEESANTKGGNDKIMTGPGMDFVDGQGGSDQVIVNLMGESETNYANITDSGTDKFDTDTLTIEGTEYNDTLLMRMNKEITQEDGKDVEGTLGFVALLPQQKTAPSEVTNDNIERVNFTRGIDVVNLNGNGGDDEITIDGTAKTTNVDGGAGKDSFQIGQLYNSERLSSGNQSIKKDDEFNTVQENANEKYLSDGVTRDTVLNVEGGVGEDSFTLLHNVGTVSMAGGRGDDTFSIHTFRKRIPNPNWAEGSKEPQFIGEPVESGVMSVDGGAGVDTLNVAGTVGDDTVLITKEGMLSDSVGVKVAGVETTNFDAGAGDDMFYVISNNEGETTNINGGFGNDTVSVGGLDEEKTLRSSDSDGQTNYVTYEVLGKDSEDLSEEERKNVSDFSDKKKGVVRSDKFIVMDTSTQPVVFYSANENFIDLSNVVVSANGEAFFYIGFTGDIKSGSIDVVLNVPMLSSTAVQHGDRGIVIKEVVTGKTTEYSDEVRLTFDKDNKIAKISVKVLEDGSFEESCMYSITAKSYWNNAGKEEKLERSVNVISVNVEAETIAPENEYKNLFTRSDEFNVSTNTIYLGEFAKDFDGVVSAYIKNKDIAFVSAGHFDSKAGTFTLTDSELNLCKGQTLVVNYRADRMRLDGSKLRLVYDNIKEYDIKEGGVKESLFTIKYKSEDGSNITVYSKDEAATRNDAEIYYALLGDGLVFYNKSNNRLASLHGNVSILSTKYARIEEKAGIGDHELKDDDSVIEIEKTTPMHQVLAEAIDDTQTDLNSTTFTVKYNGSIEDGKTVYVKVSVSDFDPALDNEDTHLTIIGAEKTGSWIILKFTKQNLTADITIFAKHDDGEEEYGKVLVNKKPYRIDEVDGNVNAYGQGTSVVADFDNPDLLKYKHKLTNNGNVESASRYNEKNSYDVNKMGKVSSFEVKDEKTTFVFDGKNADKLVDGCTVKIIMGDVETEWLYVDLADKLHNSFTVLSSVTDFDPANGDVYALFSDAKDYLFKDENDNTDRIFVNNQGSDEKASSKFDKHFAQSATGEQTEILDSVEFTHSELNGKVVANHFEFGEYNLGSGKDTVDISKTLYRKDGFQTFTVVNTGDGEDQIKVHSYKDGSDGQLVINAQEGGDDTEGRGDKIEATSDDITKNGMVVFGGEGRDTINVKQGVIAFGDMGNIQYKNAKGEVVTNLGYGEIEDESHNKYIGTLYTRISKDADGKLEKQTDGVARGATSIKSVGFDVGKKDVITAGGSESIVVGGFANDSISVKGGMNVVLGDNGEVKYKTNETATTTWHDNEHLHKYLESVATIEDHIGDADTINITGDNNVAMGGDKKDAITIGVVGQQNSGCNNVVLGDGGIALFTKDDTVEDENSEKVTPYKVETTHNSIGDNDTIKIYGGGNVAMGGAADDDIYIGESGYDSDNNVVLGDGGKYELEKNVSLDISTADDTTGGVDTIEIHGGKNAVMGGFRKDTIDIFGADNVVLGDGGHANYDKHPEVVKNDNNVNAGLIKVETTADEINVVKEGDKLVRLNDDITIHGDINIVMGGVDDDHIVIDGADNVVVGDAGVYTVRAECLTVETKNETFGGQDFIRTGDGQNTILGGTDADTILTGTGNDIIVGDGGLVIMDKPEGNYKGHNPLIVTNSGKNITDQNEDEKSAGGDFIHAGDGNNVIFGGLGNDEIDSGNGEDVVFGDNGYATFRGNADLANNLHETFTDLNGVFDFKNSPDVHTSATLSFNFQGTAQQGINADEIAGADGFKNKQWNNISGSLAGTYGNDDKEMVRFDDGTRASSVSVTYAGREAHRKTSTDNSINTQNYNHWLWGNSADNKLMTSGIMTTAPNNQMQNVMEVTVDGLKQHFDSYQIAVYMDIPDAHSWETQSVRLVSLYIDGVRQQAFYVNDPARANFTGEFKNRSMEAKLDGDGNILGVEVVENGQTVIKPMDSAIGSGLAWSNYVVFDVGANIASDRIVIVIEDGVKEWNMNGKDLPGIAGLQIKGQLHKQDIAASTDVEFGGDDAILARSGDDIVVGGTGRDTIVTHGTDDVIRNGKVISRAEDLAADNAIATGDHAQDEAVQEALKQKRENDAYVRAHTTFGDDRLGIYDNDVVFGDNAKMLFTERDGDLSTASTLTTAESVSISKDQISHSEIDEKTGKERKNEEKYKDTIITGDGNDVVVGGIGADRIEAGATPAANEMMDGINVLSINFTREHSNATDSIAAGETAGVVVDNEWHNFYRNDRGVIVSDSARSQSAQDPNAYNQAMNYLCNNPDGSNPYARAEGVEVHMYGKMNGNRQGASSFTIENHDEIDGDTSNSKLYNTYIASQQSEEIVLKLQNLDTFVTNSGNTVDKTSFDLYVYLGGDNNDTDTFNYLYEIKLTDDKGNVQRRYLNDWTGHKFDGDYREAYCDNREDAVAALADFTTPRVSIIGNYVVFHGVTGNLADIRIRNIFSFNGQSPKNLPMITALQIVSGDGRYKESENGSLVFNDKHYELADIAIGGDHDKDLVYGDDAKLWFDLDVPFASDENIQNYKNRVIEAKSVAVADKVAEAVSTKDMIITGKDRDVVVGGEGADTIKMGDGDDVALGGNANLIVEHNNPVGVFTPNTEIVLDQHTIDLNSLRNYLDNDNANVQQFQSMLDQHRIQGIDTNVSNTNDRKDTFEMGSGRNLTSEGSWSTEKLVKPQMEPEDPNGQGQGQNGNSNQSGNEGQNGNSNQSGNEGQNGNSNQSGNEGQNGNTNQSGNEGQNGNSNQSGNEGQNGNSNQNGNTEVRVEVLTQTPQIFALEAGQTVKFVCSDYPKGNQWWTPNVVIYGNNAGNSLIPEIDWAWDGSTKVHTNTAYNIKIDIPDHPNGANGMYEIYLTAKTSGLVSLYVEQG